MYHGITGKLKGNNPIQGEPSMLPEVVSDFLFGVVTPAAFGLSAIALIITSFARGWIVSRFTVETLIQGYKELIEQEKRRADDWKALYFDEKESRILLQQVGEKMTALGETSAKILAAIPTTPEPRD